MGKACTRPQTCYLEKGKEGGRERLGQNMKQNTSKLLSSEGHCIASHASQTTPERVKSIYHSFNFNEKGSVLRGRCSISRPHMQHE